MVRQALPSRCRLNWHRDSATGALAGRTAGHKLLQEDMIMTAGNVFALALPARHAASCITAAAAIAVSASLALAQTNAPAPIVPAPKATPRPVAPKQAPPKQPQAPAAAQQPAAPGAPAAPGDQAAAPAAEQPPIVYSPWTKFCGKDNNNPQ